MITLALQPPLDQSHVHFYFPAIYVQDASHFSLLMSDTKVCTHPWRNPFAKGTIQGDCAEVSVLSEVGAAPHTVINTSSETDSFTVIAVKTSSSFIAPPMMGRFATFGRRGCT